MVTSRMEQTMIPLARETNIIQTRPQSWIIADVLLWLYHKRDYVYLFLIAVLIGLLLHQILLVYGIDTGAW